MAFFHIKGAFIAWANAHWRRNRARRVVYRLMAQNARFVNTLQGLRNLAADRRKALRKLNWLVQEDDRINRAAAISNRYFNVRRNANLLLPGALYGELQGPPRLNLAANPRPRQRRRYNQGGYRGRGNFPPPGLY